VPGRLFLWPVRPDNRGDLGQDYAQFDLVVDGKYHTGLDIAAPSETAVAAAGGRVVKIQENDDPAFGCDPNIGGSCEDQGFGNTVIVQHNLPDSVVYSQYSHLATIEESLKLACGPVDPGRRKRRTCADPVPVNAGDALGSIGGSGFGQPSFWSPHLHFEIKTFSTLGTSGDDAGEFGYTLNPPKEEGFRDQMLSLHSITEFTALRRVRVTENGVNIRIGPGGAGGTLYRILAQVNAGEEYEALRSSGATTIPDCPGGWYQIQREGSGRLVDADLGGEVIDGWVCADFASSVTLPQLSNISTRGVVQTGDNVQIGGFIIGGTDSKTVLIRARGPVLADFGVPGVLNDPVLQLFSGQTVIAENDDWETTLPLCQNSGLNCGGAAEITATGLDPCVGNMTGCARESAILVALDPGPYTAIVSGVGGGTGVGLVEVFEVGTTTNSRLTNISTRGLVGTGDDVMIGGLIIAGTDPKTVLIRARGPVLTDFGVPGELSDPFLQLFSGQTVITQNDNWQVTDPLCGSPAVSCGGAAEITATGLDPCVGNMTGCARESAILVTLPPGPYTAIVSGVGGGTGVGLVEVFEVSN